MKTVPALPALTQGDDTLLAAILAVDDLMEGMQDFPDLSMAERTQVIAGALASPRPEDIDGPAARVGRFAAECLATVLGGADIYPYLPNAAHVHAGLVADFTDVEPDSECERPWCDQPGRVCVAKIEVIGGKQFPSPLVLCLDHRLDLSVALALAGER